MILLGWLINDNDKFLTDPTSLIDDAHAAGLLFAYYVSAMKIFTWHRTITATQNLNMSSSLALV